MPISVTLLGMVTEVKAVVWANALVPMVFNAVALLKSTEVNSSV